MGIKSAVLRCVVESTWGRICAAEKGWWSALKSQNNWRHAGEEVCPEGLGEGVLCVVLFPLKGQGCWEGEDMVGNQMEGTEEMPLYCLCLNYCH